MLCKLNQMNVMALGGNYGYATKSISGRAIPEEPQSGPRREWDSLHDQAASDGQRFLLDLEVRQE